MPDMDLQKTGETGAARDRGGRSRKGRSGNPAGRPRGSVNAATRAAMLLLDGEAERLTRKAVELALKGDPAALRLCLERIIGARRGRPAPLELPAVASVADLTAAMTAVVAAAAEGSITPDEAFALSQTVESFTRTFEAAYEEICRNWRLDRWRRSEAAQRQAALRKEQGGTGL